jgi:hypothetical protein
MVNQRAAGIVFSIPMLIPNSNSMYINDRHPVINSLIKRYLHVRSSFTQEAVRAKLWSS